MLKTLHALKTTYPVCVSTGMGGINGISSIPFRKLLDHERKQHINFYQPNDTMYSIFRLLYLESLSYPPGKMHFHWLDPMICLLSLVCPHLNVFKHKKSLYSFG